MRQQVLHAFRDALSMQSTPLPALLALEDGLQLIVLLLCFIIRPRPAPASLIIALTATSCLSLWQRYEFPKYCHISAALMLGGAMACMAECSLGAVGSDMAMAEAVKALVRLLAGLEATPYRGGSLLACLNALVVYECCVISSGRLLWLLVIFQIQA